MAARSSCQSEWRGYPTTLPSQLEESRHIVRPCVVFNAQVIGGINNVKASQELHQDASSHACALWITTLSDNSRSSENIPWHIIWHQICKKNYISFDAVFKMVYQCKHITIFKSLPIAMYCWSDVRLYTLACIALPLRYIASKHLTLDFTKEAACRQISAVQSSREIRWTCQLLSELTWVITSADPRIISNRAV